MIDSSKLKNIADEHKQEVEQYVLKDGDVKLLKVPCIGDCTYGKVFYTLRKYKKEIVTCPHCNQKHSVRLFKNGKVNVTLMGL
nr:hypothetical protein [Clostridioides sp.]